MKIEFDVQESKKIKGVWLLRPPIFEDLRGNIWTSFIKDEVEKLRSQECFLGQDIDPFPKCESLKDTFKRLMPFIDLNLTPLIKNNKNILISAHGNSIRAMLKFFEKISDNEIAKVEISTGEPLHLLLNDELKVLDKKYL